MKNIKEEIVLEINRQISELYPTKGLKIVNMNMSQQSDITNFAAIAQYVNKELYHLYLDFENLILNKENKPDINKRKYFSEFANSIKSYNNQFHVILMNRINTIFSK